MNNLALVINTHSSCADLWDIFFDQLKKYFPAVKTHVFTDTGEFDADYEISYYDKEQQFRSQFLSCIGNVKEEYSIFISEDYFLIDKPNLSVLKDYIGVLDKNKNISFIRLAKGMTFGEPYFKGRQDLYEMSPMFPYFYSQSATLWRTRDLELIFESGPDLHIGGTKESEQFEVAATRTCQMLDIRGLYCYHGEPKRGIYHHDCSVFPHIATAIVKGKWNLSEYPNELGPLLEEYDIDVSVRGVY